MIARLAFIPIALVAGFLLWSSRHCTGPTPADRCTLAGSSKASPVNTSVKSLTPGRP